MQKYYLFCVLWTCLATCIKNDNANLWKRWCLSACKKWTLFFFWVVVKILKTCYFDYFENTWSWPSTTIVPPCRTLWYPKCWNQFAGNFDVYMHAKNELLLWNIVKALQSCYFANFGNAWPSPSKIIVKSVQNSLADFHYFLLY